jgi:hypothetical protein
MKFQTLFVTALCFSVASVTIAHEGDCPYCKLKLVQNTADQDNEVVLRFGNKKIEYRCVFCVFKDQKRYKGDLVVYAPSEKVGEPVILKRTEGKWTGPDGVVFLNSFKKHVDCAALSRAFSNVVAYDAYVKKNDLKDTKALTLVEFIDFVVKPAK